MTVGFKQTYVALRECWKLKQTFLYLVFYFLMGDVLNTTVTVIGTLQNSVVAYSTLQLTLLLIVLTIWGLAGVHTSKFGFKNVWEIWCYQAFYGFMVGKTSAFIGPFVSSAIISASDNNNMPFAFLFGLGAFSCIFLYMVDVKKSRIECEEFIQAEMRRNAFDDSEFVAAANEA
ncbi:hypothetical protein HWV62_2280 [Athelia sp. TMB]|nr:hypothetical protein HWV62_2280 [Athelia sp. TMB]